MQMEVRIININVPEQDVKKPTSNSRACLAQSVERVPFKHVVMGSSPMVGIYSELAQG